MPVRFRAEVQQEKGTSAYVDVPPQVLAKISAKRRVPVTVTVNGYTFRTTIAPMKGCLLLGFNKANAAAAEVSAGQTIDILMDVDLQPREVEVPPELAAALATSSVARAAFDRLSYTHRREWAEHVAQAKRPETRERRAQRAVAELEANSSAADRHG